jgi:hypothetical protein
MKYARHHWKTGDYVPGLYGEGFTAAHWFLPKSYASSLREMALKPWKWLVWKDSLRTTKERQISSTRIKRNGKCG